MDRAEIKKHVDPILARCTVLDRPDVRNRLIDLWGSDECREYLLSLLVAERPDRQGLPQEDFSAILLILTIHDYAYPLLNPSVPKVVFSS